MAIGCVYSVCLATWNQVLQRRAVLLAFALPFALMQPGRSWAQSVVAAPNDTGTIVAPVGNRFDITGGALSGNRANLFHGFSQFGLSQGQTANFLSNPQIQNILVRVNGGNPSIINGLLQVSGGSSNLFLMNPSGVVFGQGASLNLTGSFAVTTGNGIGFDRGWFNAVGRNDYASLIGSPNSFAFTMGQPGAVVNAGNLTVGEGQRLSLLGGMVVNTGRLVAPGGQVNVLGVAGSQVLRLSEPGSPLSLVVTASGVNDGGVNRWVLPILRLPQLLTGAGVETGVGVEGSGVKVGEIGRASCRERVWSDV